MAQEFNPNALYYGDCLDWMREWESDCVDLIYLDPPFNSNANYNLLFGQSQKATTFIFRDGPPIQTAIPA